MPWEQRYIEAPRDLSLEVLEKLPEDAMEMQLGVKEAWRGAKRWHFCQYCKGWIPGNANAFKVNNLSILCGRQGTEFHCKRCGQQIAFEGIMA